MPHLMKLSKHIDFHLAGLLGRFISQAIASGDPKTFLTNILEVVVEADEDPSGKPQEVTVEVLPALKGRKR
jgi:hypothetical protein